MVPAWFGCGRYACIMQVGSERLRANSRKGPQATQSAIELDQPLSLFASLLLTLQASAAFNIDPGIWTAFVHGRKLRKSLGRVTRMDEGVLDASGKNDMSMMFGHFANLDGLEEGTGDDMEQASDALSTEKKWFEKSLEVRGHSSETKHRAEGVSPYEYFVQTGCRITDEREDYAFYRDQFWSGHVPVLLLEALKVCLPAHLERTDGKYDGTYVDCTFGRGGHSRQILAQLSEHGRLFAFDVDPDAVAVGRKMEQQDKRFQIIHRPFGDIGTVLAGVQLDGVLLDLGVCSPQLDEGERGSNLLIDAPLDMRFNPQGGVSASDWLRTASREEIAWVFANYGEEEIQADRIAQAIVDERLLFGHVERTGQLSQLICRAKGKMDDRAQHPAKMPGRAIGMFLNQELQQLEQALEGIFKLLGPGCHCAVITFKELEANIISRKVREHEDPDEEMLARLPRRRLLQLYPLLGTEKDYAIMEDQVPTRPTQMEIFRNPQARSATLHDMVKVVRHSPFLGNGVSDWPEEERFVEPIPPPLGNQANRI